MRTYGRITNADGTKTWKEVTTDPSGLNDPVYLTTLCQVLQLNIAESPFNAGLGIDQTGSIFSQVYPDFYVMRIQTFFAPLFASLIITKTIPNSANINQQNLDPYYTVTVITHSGDPLPPIKVPI